MNIESFLNAKLISQNIKIEKTNRPCFLGAWYYKVVSNLDKYLGIEATITLPEFIVDENRYQIKKETFYSGNDNLTYKLYNDTPSIYMGGCAENESDVGLGYFRGVTDDQKNVISDEKFTFRPFWRYIYQDQDGKEINKYEGTTIYQTEYYYLPGDKLRMLVFSPVKDYLQMVIEVVETTTIPKYVAIREKFHLKDNKPANLITPLFPSFGYGIIDAEFKRVNAIDQYSNEGRPVQETKAEVLPMKWEQVYLFKEVDGEIVKVLFNDDLIAQKMRCPRQEAFVSQPLESDSSGEVVRIKPSRGEE